MATKAPEAPHTPGEYLKDKQRRLRSDFGRDFGTRVHRAISWLQRAEKETGDPDAQFIFLWISFNSAYSVYENLEFAQTKERERLQNFFNVIVTLDEDGVIYETLWENFSAQIRSILNNHYVYAPFWHHQNGISGFDEWDKMFQHTKRLVNKALASKNSTQVLTHLFDRLYVLRNQLMHGGSTWNSQVNRSQVKDGADILKMLVPRMIDLMLNNENQNWGEIYYQVIE